VVCTGDSVLRSTSGLSRCKRVSTNLCLSCAAHRSEAIHAKYGGDKNLVLVEGDHNSPRPRFLYDSIGIFLTQTLQVSALYSSCSMPLAVKPRAITL
jgi:hypothetical protein